MEMCRACLKTGSDMAQLDEPFIIGYNLLTNLNISLFDNRPQYSCQNCRKTVNFFLDFREKCITSESMLQQTLLEKIKPEPGNNAGIELIIDKQNDQIFYIKQEVKVEGMEASDYCGDGINMVVTGEESEDMKPKRIKHIKMDKKKKAKQEIKLDVKIEELLDVPCGLCEQTFKDQDKLNKHLESHKNENRCDICKEMFRNWPALFGHRFTHLMKKEWRRCHICDKAVFSDIYLEYHYLNVHYEGENKILTCKHCSEPYESVRKLKNHIKAAHTDPRFVCDVCKQTFNNKHKFISHIRSHGGNNKRYFCDSCDYSCKQSNSLKIHKIGKHAPKKSTCKICQKSFATGKDLEKHICKERSKVCPFCGIQIHNERLSRHIDSHSKVGKYKCDRCPAAFKSRRVLNEHIDRHDGIRTQQCEFCPLKFYSITVLTKHRRVHTGEKPYVCKICGKGFTGSHNLKLHMRVHGEHLIVKRNKEPDEAATVK